MHVEAMRRVVLFVAALVATSACGSEERSISVVLLHCGLEPVTVEGRLWEAPPQTVDGDSKLPLDATNRPDDWTGTGTVVVAGDRMTYTDEGGEVVEFVPDDGVPPDGCR